MTRQTIHKGLRQLVKTVKEIVRFVPGHKRVRHVPGPCKNSSR
ncbi:hypothetical protein [Desulfosarcina variabilis]